MHRNYHNDTSSKILIPGFDYFGMKGSPHSICYKFKNKIPTSLQWRVKENITLCSSEPTFPTFLITDSLFDLSILVKSPTTETTIPRMNIKLRPFKSWVDIVFKVKDYTISNSTNLSNIYINQSYIFNKHVRLFGKKTKFTNTKKD